MLLCVTNSFAFLNLSGGSSDMILGKIPPSNWMANGCRAKKRWGRMFYIDTVNGKCKVIKGKTTITEGYALYLSKRIMIFSQDLAHYLQRKSKESWVLRDRFKMALTSNYLTTQISSKPYTPEVLLAYLTLPHRLVRARCRHLSVHQ